MPEIFQENCLRMLSGNFLVLWYDMHSFINISQE